MTLAKFRNRSGQTMIEYIIIVVLIAVGGLVLFGFLGDVLKKKTSGAISSMDGGQEASDAQAAAQTDSTQVLRDLDASGVQP